MNIENNNNINKEKFKKTLVGLLERISIVCVRMDKNENPNGLSSYDKIALAKVAVSSIDVNILLQHYNNIFSKYRTYINKRDVMFFKNVQLYPNISQSQLDFIFRMFEKEYGLKEREKEIIWRCLDKLIYYIDNIQ